MIALPGGIVDGQRRPRPLRLAAAVDWYLVTADRFELLGSGDLSERDAKAIRDELRASYPAGAVFVGVARPREIEDILPSKWGTRRITWSERLRRPIAPSRAAVARGARLAVLSSGPVWVDSERLFTPGESVPLPWTEPPVSLRVLRPRQLRRELDGVLGRAGPRRARLLGRQG